MSWKSWKLWVALNVIIALIGILAYGLTTDPKLVPSPWIGRTAPDFAVVSMNDGTPLKLSDLKGKPVVLNFWASWCFECRVEAGVLEAFYQKYDRQADQVHMVGIAIQDTAEKAKAFAQHFGKTYFLALDDKTGTIALDYGIYGVPETFFIDADGIVRHKKVGGVTTELLMEQLKEWGISPNT